MGLGWSYDVSYEGVTKKHLITPDWSLNSKIRAVAQSELDCSEVYKDSKHPEAYWLGCGYPNKYLVLNRNLPDPIDDLPEDALLTVEMWDQS
jgi:hypothetical protein